MPPTPHPGLRRLLPLLQPPPLPPTPHPCLRRLLPLLQLPPLPLPLQVCVAVADVITVQLQGSCLAMLCMLGPDTVLGASAGGGGGGGSSAGGAPEGAAESVVVGGDGAAVAGSWLRLARVACASVEAATQLHALLSEACGQVARRRATSPWQRQLLLE